MKRDLLPLVRVKDFKTEVDAIVHVLAEGDLSEAMRDSARIADNAIGRNFAAQAGPHSGGWAPRKEEGDGHPLEIESGDLFQAETSPFGRGHIEEIGPRSVSIGVDPDEIPYAFAQNYGRPDINLPARESADIDQEAEDAIVDRVADGLIEALM